MRFLARAAIGLAFATISSSALAAWDCTDFRRVVVADGFWANRTTDKYYGSQSYIVSSNTTEYESHSEATIDNFQRNDNVNIRVKGTSVGSPLSNSSADDADDMFVLARDCAIERFTTRCGVGGRVRTIGAAIFGRTALQNTWNITETPNNGRLILQCVGS